MRFLWYQLRKLRSDRRSTFDSKSPTLPYQAFKYDISRSLKRVDTKHCRGSVILPRMEVGHYQMGKNDPASEQNLTRYDCADYQMRMPESIKANKQNSHGY